MEEKLKPGKTEAVQDGPGNTWGATVSKGWRDYSTLITLGNQISTISKMKDLMAAGKDLTLTFQQRESRETSIAEMHGRQPALPFLRKTMKAQRVMADS